MHDSALTTNRKKSFLLLLTFICSASAVLGSSVSATELVKWERLDSAEVHAATLTVSSSTSLQLDVINIIGSGFSNAAGYAWIIDGKTRDEVWSSDDKSGRRFHNDRSLSEVVDTVTLAPGTYDLYYYAAIGSNKGGNFSNWKGDFNGVIDNIFWDSDKITSLAEDCFVVATTLSGSATASKWTEPFPNALFSSVRVGDDKRIRYGFELLKPMSVRLYTHIELPTGDADPVDNCWISSADNSSRVWEANRRTTSRAGGSNKNRRFLGDIPLQAGKYVLNYSTDDSHSAEGFNSQPPYDPNSWGVVLLPGANFDKSAFRTFEVGDRGKPLIDLTRIRNDEDREVPFTLAKDAKFLLVAEGEYAGGADEFADYAWITEARTNQVAWEMLEENTSHAGGASKNRIFEGVVSLKAGSYSLHFSSDDSHAYHDWNSAAPSEPAAWGVAMYPPPGETSVPGLTVSDEIQSHRSYRKDKDKYGSISYVPRAGVTIITPPTPPKPPKRAPSGIPDPPSYTPSGIEHSDEPVLAAITRVRDDQERQLDFTVDKLTVVDIYAIGEGAGEEMADYGWIENAKTGQTVWEMDYFETRRAGGAAKNRQESATIELPAGSYRVFYVTDGSHSYRNWNADPPRDPDNYGITIYKHQ